MTEAFASKVTYYQFCSNRDLAEAAGISPRTLGRILAGTANAKPDVASRLKTALHVSQGDEAEFFLLAAGHSDPDVEHATGREATALHAMDISTNVSFAMFKERLTNEGSLSMDEVGRFALEATRHGLEVTASVMNGRAIVFDPNLLAGISP